MFPTILKENTTTVVVGIGVVVVVFTVVVFFVVVVGTVVWATVVGEVGGGRVGHIYEYDSSRIQQKSLNFASGSTILLFDVVRVK